MIRLSRLADYGVVLTTHLARQPERWLTATELAATTMLPLPTVAKVLKLLAQDGVVGSHRGIKGGYALARPPGEITVADIVAALDGPIALTECASAEGCGIESLCPTRVNWQTINQAVTETLASVTLADMAAPPPFAARLERAPAVFERAAQ
jgi:FeS assembly SUF system regulator